jgi:fructose-1,6-bisphosphatase
MSTSTMLARRVSLTQYLVEQQEMDSIHVVPNRYPQGEYLLLFDPLVLTREDLRIPDDTREFAINMSNQRDSPAPVKRCIDECIAGKDGLGSRHEVDLAASYHQG